MVVDMARSIAIVGFVTGNTENKRSLSVEADSGTGRDRHGRRTQQERREQPGLVRIEAAGMCHSDLSVVDGNRVRPVPMLLGHEAAGIVEKVGGTSDLAVGQRVVMTFLPRCGQCRSCATDGLAPCIPGSAACTADEIQAFFRERP